MTRRRRSLGTAVALVLTAALALAGCDFPATGTWNGSGSKPVNPPAGASTVRWTGCQDEAEHIAGSPLSGTRVECGVLRVPQDWSKPSGATFDLALMRIRRTTSRPTGSLLVNPGGPGASGIELAAYAALFLPIEIRRAFDIVGFDPRGVGRSSEVACFSDREKDALTAVTPDPVSQADYESQVAQWRTIGVGCQQKYGDSLGRFNTEQTARDMDAIRAAVGDPKMTYLGFSYGTLLGATYAQLFPGKIRALVLDGAVDPRQGDVAASEGQAAGFEKAFDNFAADCKRRGSACPIGSDPRKTVTRLLGQVRARPVPGRGGETRSATDGYALLAVVSALYSQSEWPKLASAIANLDAGDPTAVFQLADAYNERDRDGHYNNQIDANTAINCADEKSPPSLEKIRALQSQWRSRYPLFGAALAMSLLGCSVWPAKRDAYPTGAAVGAPPIVVVGTTGDPATPYENTAKLARMLGTGVVLTWNGEGHTAYPQTACIRDSVDQYLLTLRPPEDGKTCPPR